MSPKGDLSTFGGDSKEVSQVKLGDNALALPITYNKSQTLPDNDAQKELSPSAMRRNKTKSTLNPNLNKKLRLKRSRNQKKRGAPDAILDQYTYHEESKKQLQFPLLKGNDSFDDLLQQFGLANNSQSDEEKKKGTENQQSALESGFNASRENSPSEDISADE